MPGESVSASDFKLRYGCFNPRPALMPGESQAVGCTPTTDELFQSTPGINAGRICATSSPRPETSGFNPRPALMPGESPGVVLCEGEVCMFQSTPGINAGRIGVGGFGSLHSDGCFNPRPALMPGESATGRRYSVSVYVSIHARH